MKKLNVGIAGAGALSDFHIKAYQNNPYVELAALCDQNITRAREKAELYKIPKVYESFNDLCANIDIDAVSIITYNCSHMPLSIQALEAGKHVLCEKPPALTAEEAQKMARAARENRRVLMTGFVRRFSEKNMLAKSIIEKHELGDIYYVKTGFLRRCGCPGGWFADKALSGGGPLLDIGVHMIDQALYLMGRPKPVSVFGNVNGSVGTRAGVKGFRMYMPADFAAQDFSSDPVEDFANALIRFDNGASLFAEASWTMNIKSDTVYMDMFGDKGGLKVDPTLELFSQHGDYLTDTQPVIIDDDPDFERAFGREIDHFVDCILRETLCISSIEDGAAVMKIIDAIYRSAKTGDVIRIDS